MDSSNSDIVNFLIQQMQTNEPKIEKEDNAQVEPDNKPDIKRIRRAHIPKCNDFCEVVIPSYTAEEFRQAFRMSRSCFTDLLNKLSSKVKIFNIEKKLLFATWMLGSRDTFASASPRFGLAQGAAYQYFCDIIDGLIVMFKQHVAWPAETEFPHIEQGFKPDIGGYVPGIIGAIDGCHIPIKKPSRYSIYCNSRNTHSIILQAVCDHQKIFTDVYVGAPGCLHADRVFSNSPLSKEIERLIPEDYHIVGRPYYPLMRNLVVPFTDEGMLTETQKHFNECLHIASAKAEEALRLLQARFRRLTYLDTSKPELANKMVCACIILHNHVLLTDPADDADQLIQDENPQLFLNADAEDGILVDGDCNGLMKRNYLLSLFDFI